jgi:hypothetical protein
VLRRYGSGRMIATCTSGRTSLIWRLALRGKRFRNRSLSASLHRGAVI